MDFYIEMNQPTTGNHKFSYLPVYELTNCVVSKYKGHPQNVSMATIEVSDYIKKHKIDSISPVHQLMKIDKKIKKERTKEERS
ncbi:MAG: hypothetical protein RBQ97_11000 [Acholeplasma sp.]|nr:hypothetical protein [Acholeplasma sp.]